MINELSAVDLFATLNIAVIEYSNDDFSTIGTVPPWFVNLYQDALQQNILMPVKKIPFLENFLIDAEYFWQGNETEPLKSGIWSEIDTSGNECYLEATAVRLEDRKLLLISLLSTEYEEKHSLIQQGRENSLIHYRLFKEIQKKEILIHCLVHDLAGELTAINYCFQLLELQNLTSKGREYVEIGKKQTVKQELLIQEILNAFSADLRSWENVALDLEAPDILGCTMEVVDAFLPTFILNKMNLQLILSADIIENWKVVGDKIRLERVISNLIENAFRHSSPESTVTVSLEEEGRFIVLSVDDQGSGVQPDIANNLFKNFFQGKEKSGRAGLGLYFCRMTVERWGGTIGYLPLERGSRFWFRLPKAALITN